MNSPFQRPRSSETCPCQLFAYDHTKLFLVDSKEKLLVTQPYGQELDLSRIQPWCDENGVEIRVEAARVSRSSSTSSSSGGTRALGLSQSSPVMGVSSTITGACATTLDGAAPRHTSIDADRYDAADVEEEGQEQGEGVTPV